MYTYLDDARKTRVVNSQWTVMPTSHPECTHQINQNKSYMPVMARLYHKDLSKASSRIPSSHGIGYSWKVDIFKQQLIIAFNNRLITGQNLGGDVDCQKLWKIRTSWTYVQWPNCPTWCHTAKTLKSYWHSELVFQSWTIIHTSGGRSLNHIFMFKFLQ